MTAKFIVFALLAAGLINAAPVIGLLSAERLRGLYGIAVEDPSLLVLMRHRALMLGLLGGFALASIWITPWRLPAMSGMLISMLVFNALAWFEPQLNGAVRKVMWVDIVLCLALIPALVLQWQQASNGEAAT